MAVITEQPFVIDTTNKTVTSNENFCPLFIDSGKAYVQLNTNISGSPRPTRTYSCSAIPTFTEQDTGVTPNTGSQCATRGSDGKIYFAATNNGGTATSILSFDPATDTYDTSIADMPVVFNPFLICRLSSGDIHVYSVAFGGGDAGKLYQYVYASGSWSVKNTVLNNANYERTIVRAATDSSDRSHLFFSMRVDATHRDIWYMQIASDGTVAIAAALAYNMTVHSAASANTGNVVLDESNDKAYFIFAPRSGPALTDHIPRVVTGTTLASPTFATQELDPGQISLPGSGSEQDQELRLFLAMADGVLSGFWTVSNASIFSPPDQIIGIWMNTLTAGVWGTPEHFYDAINNLPTGIDSADFNVLGSLTTYWNGSSWIGTTSMNENGPSSFRDVDVFLGVLGTVNNYISAGGPLANRGFHASP